MRFLLFAALFGAIFFFVHPDPILRFPEKAEDLPEQVANIPVHHRARRATCDLISGTKIENVACAAHCIAMGHKGGYCNSNLICICR